MAQPDYVPVLPRDKVRVSERLPTPEPWYADRPGEVVQRGRQPAGPRFGTNGPDQGYALRLVHQWTDKLVLAPGEHLQDAVAGSLGVALKRASLFGRAPVTYDLEMAFSLWGFLPPVPPELLTRRQRIFESAAHEYNKQRDIADQSPERTLRLTPAEVRHRLATGDWQSLFDADTHSHNQAGAPVPTAG
jgi:hypothetical protein